MSSETYRSTGTIRVQFELAPPKSDSNCNDKNGGCESQWSTEIFFTPIADSTVCCGDKKYAVFIGGNDDKPCLRSELRDSGEGIQIKVTTDLPGLVAAAAQQTLVEVKVNSKWALQSITIPATRKKR